MNRRVIDISAAQGLPDWDAVAASGMAVSLVQTMAKL